MARIKAQSFASKLNLELVVRNANAKDSEALLAMMDSVLEEQVFSLTEPKEMNLSLEQEMAWIESMNNHPSHLLLVAEIESKLIGMLDFGSSEANRTHGRVWNVSRDKIPRSRSRIRFA